MVFIQLTRYTIISFKSINWLLVGSPPFRIYKLPALSLRMSTLQTKLLPPTVSAILLSFLAVMLCHDKVESSLRDSLMCSRDPGSCVVAGMGRLELLVASPKANVSKVRGHMKSDAEGLMNQGRQAV